MAGGDHYRNFKAYMKHGGLKYFFGKAGLIPGKAITKGNGIFIVATAATRL
jgi:hypothetical protein